MRSINRRRFTLLLALVLLVPGAVFAQKKGISQQALDELADVGVNKYLGQYTPVSSEDVGEGWVKHTFDRAGGEGPICIDGSEYSMYTRKGRDKKKLLVMLQGGGACWQGLYECAETTAFAEPPFDAQGIWDFKNKLNPFARYNIAYFPYCDGSVFLGDNTVVDPAYDSETGVDGVRQHRGLRNLSAGLDVTRDTFRKARRVTIAGSSAGGVGASFFAPFLVRFLYGNSLKDLNVFNDSGAIVANLDAQDAAAARANDWAFAQYFPASCTDCGAFNQPSALIKWRLEHDTMVRDAFYETDADQVNIGFTSVNLPGFFDPLPPIVPFPSGLSQNQFRDLYLDVTDDINEAYPDRYRRFIVSGDDSHVALQSEAFYTKNILGVTLDRWTRDFVKNRKSWWDLIEDFKPVPEE